MNITSRRDFLKAAGGLCFGAGLLSSLIDCGDAHASGKADRPNIVFVLADDLGWNGIGPNGNTDVDTPNLDRLAKDGMRFTNAYAEAQCSPARAALISGQWPARSGMFAVVHEEHPIYAPMTPPQRLKYLPPEIASMAKTLQDCGYKTAISGKWHTGRSKGVKLEDFGFDHVGPSARRSKLKDKGITEITDDLLGFIKSNKDKPFFAYFSHNAVHTPLEALPELKKKYADRGFKESSTPRCIESERPTAEYYAMIDHLDDSIGRIVQTLERLGIAKKTLLIFTSDNGGLSRMADMYPLRSSKGSPYEGGLRIPMIARWPGVIPAGATCDEPVHFVDYYPTFVEVAGGNIASVQHTLDGTSILPLLKGQTSRLPREDLYWHMPTYTANYGRTPCSVIRSGPWKLIHYFGDYLENQKNKVPFGDFVLGPRTELYNLKLDPSETKDLADIETTRKNELLKRLRAWHKDTNAAMPTRNPNFKPEKWWLKE
jgi:arylsulfatase A